MSVPRERLEGWKAIAGYLDRHVSTVRRWARRTDELRLPTFRMMGRTCVTLDDLDAWWKRVQDRRHGDGP